MPILVRYLGPNSPSYESHPFLSLNNHSKDELEKTLRGSSRQRIWWNSSRVALWLLPMNSGISGRKSQNLAQWNCIFDSNFSLNRSNNYKHKIAWEQYLLPLVSAPEMYSSYDISAGTMIVAFIIVIVTAVRVNVAKYLIVIAISHYHRHCNSGY